jgi:hypothetical protein
MEGQVCDDVCKWISIIGKEVRKCKAIAMQIYKQVGNALWWWLGK